MNTIDRVIEKNKDKLSIGILQPLKSTSGFAQLAQHARTNSTTTKEAANNLEKFFPIGWYS